MQLSSLTVQNFRALTYLELIEVPGAVVLAGPNGCGKSCVLDAIRLLKSAYGSYAQDEWRMWLGELQIDANRNAHELLSILQDRSKPLVVTASFTLSDREREYIRVNAVALSEELYWKDIEPRYRQESGQASLAATRKAHEQKLKNRLDSQLPLLLAELERPVHHGRIAIDTKGQKDIQDNPLLELLFSTYMPNELGVIDYHGPNRTYNRQRLNSVNLTIAASENQQRETALYNSGNKYANLKVEMTSAYVRHLLASKADPSIEENDVLTATLKELFTTFFPGKEFQGPKPTPDGRLTFLVKLANGGEHDIDELSSGEKEVVYGYLRLHSSAPRNSMILIDEPELHLNPRLVSGLAAFYYRHLGSKLGNQLWLVSHSDTLIREAVSHPNFGVYHVQPSSGRDCSSQATAVKAKGDLEQVVLALVGDMAAYRPGAKIVIFESTETTAFDSRMTFTLFPHFEQRVNAISGGSKRSVTDLYSLLEEVRAKGHLDARFFAICDADDDETADGPSSRLEWDAYHIENYLLEPEFILKALNALNLGGGTLASSDSILEELRSCAEETINDLIAHRLRGLVNRNLTSAINLNFDPTRNDIVDAMSQAIGRSCARIKDRVIDGLSRDSLQRHNEEFAASYRAALTDGSWRNKFRGRDILKRFTGRHANGLSYDFLRELILNKMAEAGHQPLGMQKVVNAILSA